jgi:hypothetical protein
MSDKISKFKSYQQLLKRLEEAIDAGFFLEASWIAYAVIEDRICSALLKTGGLPQDKNGKSLQMLGSKLNILEKRMDEDPILRSCLEKDEILKRVVCWKNKRNPLMHSMASEAKSWSTFEREAAAVAKEGKDIAWLLANAVSRLRKRKQRQTNTKFLNPSPDSEIS